MTSFLPRRRPRLLALAPLALLAVTVFAAAPPAAAQTVAALTQVEHVISTLQTPSYPGLAVSPAGDVYMATGASGTVLKYPASGAGPVTITLPGSSPFVVAVAVDPATGNLYAGDQANGQIDVITPSGSVSQLTVDSSTAIANVQALYVANNKLYVAGGLSVEVFSVALSGGTSTEISNSFWNGVAVDGSGNVYVACRGGACTTKGVDVFVGGTGSAVAISPPGVTWAGPEQLAVDAAGDLYVADDDNGGSNSGQLVKITNPSTSPVATQVATTTSGIFSQVSPFGVAVDSLGNVYWSNRGNSVPPNLLNVSGNGSALNFFSQNVNTTTSALALTYSITGTSVTLGQTLALTQGNASLDYAVTNDGCNTKSTPATCTVKVTFKPSAAGPRPGAIVVVDSSNNRLATTYLQGTGAGAAMAFVPPSPSLTQLIGTIANQATPGGVLADAAGNVYYANNGEGTGSPYTGSIVKVGGGVLGGSQPTGVIDQIAEDGAGNIYYADVAGQQAARIDAKTGLVTHPGGAFSTAVHGVAVDAAGDLFIGNNSNQIVEVPAAHIADNNAVSNIVFTVAGTTPTNLATDNDGNIYFTNSSNPASVFELNLTTSVVTSPFTLTSADLTGVALDPGGAVYAGSGDITGIYEIDRFPTILTDSSTIAPYALSLDASANIYLTNQVGQAVDELPFATPPTLSFGTITMGQSSPAQTVIINNIGNVALTFTSINSPAGFTTGGACAVGTPVAAGGSCTLSITFTPAAGQDGASAGGNIVLTTNAISGVQNIAVSGSGEDTASALAYPIGATGVYVGGNLGTVSVNVVDSASFVDTDATNPVTVTITGPNGFSQASSATSAVAGVASVALGGITLPAAGTYTLTATSAGLTTAVEVVTVTAANVAVANTAVGSNIASTPVTVLLPAGGTVSTIAVLTRGIAGLDFTDAGSGTCATTLYAAGATCTVNVEFAPTAPGQRQGAVVLYDGSGNPLGTVYLSGVGTGGLAAFPGVGSTVATTGSSLNFMSGLATDGTNFYAGSTSSGYVAKISSVGAITQVCASCLPTGTGTASLAVDGAGNLFELSDFSSNRSVLEFVNKNGTLSSTPIPYATGFNIGSGNTYGLLAVDGAGNLYVDEYAGGNIKEIPTGGGAAVTLASGLDGNAHSLALDPAGNLYFVNDVLLKRIPAGGGSPVTITGPGYGTALAFDAAGNLYEAFAGGVGNSILVYSISGSAGTQIASYTVPGSNTYPSGMVLDSAGDIYVADSGNDVLDKIAVRTPPAFSFPATNVSQNSAAISTTLSNLGNANLAVSSVILGDTTHFANTQTCTASSPLAADATCTISVVFTPDSATTFSTTDTLTDTDFSGNGGNTTQAIGISTAAATLNTTTINLPAPASPVYGTAVTTLATVVTPGSGNPAYSDPTGTLSGYVDAPGAHAFSGLALGSGVASINVGILPAGSHTLYVSYSGDATYAAIANTSVTFTVAQVTLTPSLIGTITKTYDTTPTATAAPSNFSLAGLVNGDILGGTVTLTYSTAAYDTIHAGSGKTVTANGVALGGSSAADYTLSATTASGAVGIINQYNGLTITADNKVYTVGAASLPAFTYTVTGFLSGDTVVTSTTGAPALSSSATTGSPIGNYSIGNAVGTFSSQDYLFSLVSGNLAINQYSQAFTAAVGGSQSQTITFNAPPASVSIGSIAILTNGAASGEFSQTSTTCPTGGGIFTGYGSSGTPCTVIVKFQPTTVGLRRGAVVLYDTNTPANPIATILLNGTSTGALSAFPAVQQSELSNGLTGLYGGDTDGSYLYLAASSNVARVQIGTGTTNSTFLTLPGNGIDLKLDGADNIFVLTGPDTDHGTAVTEFKRLSDGTYGPATSFVTGLTQATAMTVDANGDVFVVTNNADDVYEYPASGATAIQLAHSSGNFDGLGVDQSGNFYYDSNNVPQKISAATIAAQTALPTATPQTGVMANHSYVFDAAGDLYTGNASPSGGISEYLNQSGTLSGSAIAIGNVTGSGPGRIYDVVLDPSGNIYALDQDNGQVVPINVQTAPGFAFSTQQDDGTTSAAQSTSISNIGNAALTFTNVAVGTAQYTLATGGGYCASSGTVPTGSSCVAKVSFAPTTPGTHPDTLTFTSNAVNSPQSVGLTGASLATTLTLTSGNNQTARVSTAFSAPLVVHVTDANGPVVGLTVTFSGPGSGASGTTTAIATDGSGNASVTFTANATNGAYSVTAAAPDAGNSVAFSLTNVNPASTFLVTPATTAVVIGSSFNFTVTAKDNLGNTDPFYSGTVQYSATGSGNTLPANGTLINGVSGTLSAILGAGGNQTLTATDTVTGSITGGVGIAVQPLTVVAPASNVGVISTTQTVTFVSPAAAIGSIAVLTNGAVSTSDFVVASGGTCLTGTQSGSSCTVNYTFKPSAVGVRHGAIVLYDTSASEVPLATILLSGTGQGGVIAFPPVNAHFAPLGFAGHGMDTDGTYLYTAEGAAFIARTLISNPSTQTTLLTGLNSPTDVKLDGAGNIYVSQGGSVVRFTRKSDGTYSTAATIATLINPEWLALDPSGNVFVADSGTDLWEYPVGGGAAIHLYNSPTIAVTGLGVDHSGNVFYSVPGTVHEIVAANLGGAFPATTTFSGTLDGDIVANPAGDLFGSDGGAHVNRYLAATSYLVQLSYPVPQGAGGLAFDAAGNLYESDSNSSITQFSFAPPVWSFGNQPDGLTSATVNTTLFNVGNATVNFNVSGVALTTGTQFSIAGSACADSGILSVGAICTAQSSFTPTTPGAASDSLTFASSAVNSPSIISLTGTGLATTLTANAGTPQSAHINAAFATPLQVKIVDSTGAAVSGISITFTAPASGASGTFSNSTATITGLTDSNGLISEVFTANATPGAGYSVTASAPDTTSASFALSNVGAATHLSAVSSLSTLVAGTPSTVTVQALDVDGQIDTTNTDTIAITLPGGYLAVLPSNAALVAGVQTFNVTLESAASQTLTATDASNGTVTAGSTGTITVTPGVAASLSLRGLPGTVQKGVPFSAFVAALDAYGNAATGYNSTVIISSSGGQLAQIAAVSGVATFTNDLTLSTGGAVTLSATDSNLTSPSVTLGVFPLSGSVGASVTSIPVTFGAAPAFDHLQVLTQGATGKDFALDATPGCTTNATPGATCTVNVDFTATAPGLRPGAVVLFDGSNHVLATTYISGVGQGPAIAFTGGAKTVLDGTDFSGPRSLAIDGGGNYYVADSTKNKIYLVAAGTVGGTGTDIGYTPAHSLQGIALDGAGNLYVAQNSGSTSTSTAELVEIPRENGVLNPADKTVIGTYAPTAVTTDAQGNVYIFDAATLKIFQISPSGTITTVVTDSLANGHFSDALTAGPDGAIYFVAGGEEFSKYAADTFSHSYITAFAGEGVLGGAAVDTAGDIFVTTTGTGNLMELAAGSGAQTTLTSSSNSIRAVALDPAGNAYILDSGSGLNKVDLADGPALAFANTSVNPTTPGSASSTVSNVGNLPLIFTTAVATPSQFSSTSTCTAQTLAASSGNTCVLSASFSPDSATAFSGTLTASDNAFTGASQALALAGSGILATPTITLTPNPSATPTYGADDTVGVVVSGLSTIPSGAALTYTLDGASGPGFGLSAGAHTVDLGVLAAGTHTVVVTYTADGTYATGNQTQTFTVAPLPITPALTGTVTKIYDSFPNATLLPGNFSLPGVLAGDAANVTASGNATYSQSTVGANLTVNATAITLSGSAAANYILSSSSASLANMGSITQRPLTATLIGTVSKVYDGTNTATLATNNFSLSPVVLTDTGNVTASSPATYPQTGIGTGLGVTASAITLSGSAAGNYSLSATTATNATMGSITPALLTVVLVDQTLPYGTDFNNAPTFNSPTIPAQYTITGFVNGENATSAGVTGYPVLGTNASKTTSVSSGVQTIFINGTVSFQAPNYTIGITGTAHLTITPLTLTASLIGTLTKSYDSTVAYSGLSSINYNLAGIVNNDTVALATYPSAGVYDSALVATSPNHVTASGLALTNNTGGNYNLAATTATGVATITAAPITASIIGSPTMVYNGTVNSSNVLTGANYQLNGVFSADTSNVSLLSTPLSGTFNAATVAAANSITVSGLAIGGSASSNYSLSSTSATGPATITAATITPALQGSVSKVYDSTTSAALIPANYTFTGNVGGDSSVAITTPGVGAYDTPLVGTGKIVTVTGLALTGSTAANYVLSSTTINGPVGAITNAPITPSLIGTVSKVYDGGVLATLTSGNYTITGKQGSDDVAITTPTAGTFDTPSVGTGKTVTGIVSLTGTSAANYHLTTSAAVGAVGTILPAPLTVTADNQQIILGAALPTYTASLSGFVNGENATTANVTGAASFTTIPPTPPGVGAYAIMPTIGTLAAPNYSFTTFVYGTLAIEPAPIAAPTTVVGQTSASVAVAFPFNTSTTVSAVGVLSNGSTDFASADSSHCVNSFAALSSCTVDVTFTPTAPGLRSGAVVLYGAGNAVITTVYISGIGQGALLNVPSAYALHSVGSSVPASGGSIVTDAGTNSYVLVDGTVYRVGPAFSETSVLTGLAAYHSIALDGAGNLFAAGSAGIALVPNENGTLNLGDASLPVSTPNVTTVVVDGAGDLFYTTSASSVVNERSAAGIVTTLGSNLIAGSPLALDSAGNVYAIDQNSFITRVNSGGQTEVGAAVSGVTALQVDAAGDIFAGSAAGILELPAASPTSPITVWSGAVASMALDSQGDIFELDPYGSLDAFYSGMPSSTYSFPLTAIAQTLPASETVLNQGNVPLSFSNVSVSTSNFAVDASNGCTTSNTVLPGGQCALNFDFTPTTNGPLSDALSLTSNNFANSSSSLALSGTGALIAQTITFAPQATAIYGAAPITLSASSTNSGIPVTLSYISGPASLSGSTLTLTGSGTVVVAADQAADATHAAAAQVQATITVAKAALTVTANPQTRVYGAANPSFTSTITGYQNSDTSSVITGSPVLATSAVAATNVGTAPITVDVTAMSAANYTFTGVNGSLTITQAPLVVTPRSVARTYGAANQVFSGTISGVLNGDGISATYSTGASPTTPVGAYSTGSNAIAATLHDPNARLGNYAVTSNFGTLTINPASVTVTLVGSVSKPYDTTATATLASANFGLNPVENGELLTIGNTTGVYASKSVGTNLNVTVSGLTLVGATASNYTLASTAVTGPVGTITPAAYTASLTGAVTKTYDGGTAAILTPANYTSSSVLAGDTVTLNDPTAGTYNNANTGTGKTITVSGLALSGADAGNYSLASTTASGAIGAITAATAAVTLSGPVNKGYDGTTAISLQPVNYLLSGILPADTTSVALNDPAVGNYSTANTGANLSITVTGLALTGPAAANYALASTSASGAIGSILPASLLAQANTATRTYGAANPTFSGGLSGAIASDNITVSFSTAAVATTPVGAYSSGADAIVPALSDPLNRLGNYTVSINDGALTITPATLTITADNKSRLYGAANPAFTFTPTGFVNGETSSLLTGAPTLASIAAAGNGVGTFPISVALNTLAAPNYTLVPVSGTLTITQAALTVTAPTLSRLYGAANPSLTASLTGFLNGDSSAVVTGTPALSTSAQTGSGVGSYAITAALGSLSSTNYGFVFVNGSLNVTPATLVVTAANATRVFGAANPVLSSTIGGFVNGDTSSVVTGAAALATSATTASNTGSYPITVATGTLSAANYGFSFVSGALTITQASQTITFPAIGFTVPGSVVALQATATSGLPVAYTVTSGSATIAGSNLTVTGPGAITVAANQAGNGNYLAAPAVSQTFSAGAPAVSLSAASLDFGSQTVNSTSAAQTILVTNSGSSALHVSTATAEAPFAASTNCSTVAVGASCSVNVTFNPTTSGSATGTLTITDDASSSPQLVSLTGSGTAPGISLTPGSISFGGEPVGTSTNAQSITILNTGTAPLVISSVSAQLPTGSSSPDFSVSGGCLSIAAGSSCSLGVTFTPSVVGARSARVILTDNAGSQFVSVSGTGTAAGISISPSSLAFPSTLVGATSFPETITVTNTGTAALSSITSVLSGDFAIQSTTCTALAAGASCSANVVYAPTLAGAESGAITLNDSLGQQPIALSGTGLAPGVNLSAPTVVFGGELVGSSASAQTVTLSNSGSGALAITSITASAGFTSSTNCANSLAAGAACSLNIGFTPSTVGEATGSITVVDSAGSQTIATTGVGTTPGLSLTPSTADFGAQQVLTTSQAQTLTLANTGTVALTLAARIPTGDFTEADSCPASLAPGTSCQLSLSFAPTALGARSGSLAVEDTNGLASTLAAFTGTGTLPGISAAPTSVFFGSQQVGSLSAAQTVTISNSGTAPLLVSSVQAFGDFSQINTCTAAAVAPGANCVVSVTMTPSTIGARTGTLQIFDNADGVRTVSLSGTGQAPGASLSPQALAFGSAPIPASGSSVSLSGTPQTVTLTNSGNAALQITSILIEGDFTQSNTCGTSLGAGSSCSISVNFSPTGLGQRTGVLVVFDNSASGAQVISLAGFGSPTGLTLTPASLNFGGGTIGVHSAPQAVTLTNATGSTITGLALTASGEFTQSNTCGTTLANGATCTMSIVLTPLTSSGITGNIGISGAISNGRPERDGLRAAAIGAVANSSLAEVALSGSGTPAGIQLSASALTFTSQAVGTTSAGQTVTITNTGSTAALTTLTLTSTPDFPYTTTCTAALAAGANCTATVSFDPTAAGARTGALTLTADGGLSASVALSGTGNGGILTVNPSTLAFGARPVGTTSAPQTVTIANTGASSLVVQSITLAGSDYALGASTCTLPQTLAAGASCTVAATYTASSAAPSAGGTITVASSFGSATVALSGSGTSQGLALSATSLTYATEGVGFTSATQTVTVSNPGSSAVTITSLSLTGSNTGDFKLTNNCPTSLAAGAQCALQVSFAPTASGARSAAVTIVNSGATQAINLTGTGATFAFALTAGQGGIQQVNAGGSASYQFTLTPGAFPETVTLACSGLPANATCAFSPSAPALAAGGAAVTDTLTISTTASTLLPPAPTPAEPALPLAAKLALTLLLLLLGLFFAVRTGALVLPIAIEPRQWAIALLVAGTLATAGCAGTSNIGVNHVNGTPAGTYQVTVTATAGTSTQTSTVSIVVQ